MKTRDLIYVFSTFQDFFEKTGAFDAEFFCVRKNEVKKLYAELDSQGNADKGLHRGMQEAMRDISIQIDMFPPQIREEFLNAVRAKTGRNFFDISGKLEKMVEIIVQRGNISNEADHRILLDYVADFPNGGHVAKASFLLEKL